MFHVPKFNDLNWITPCYGSDRDIFANDGAHRYNGSFLDGYSRNNRNICSNPDVSLNNYGAKFCNIIVRQRIRMFITVCGRQDGHPWTNDDAILNPQPTISRNYGAWANVDMATKFDPFRKADIKSTR